MKTVVVVRCMFNLIKAQVVFYFNFFYKAVGDFYYNKKKLRFLYRFTYFVWNEVVFRKTLLLINCYFECISFLTQPSTVANIIEI